MRSIDNTKHYHVRMRSVYTNTGTYHIESGTNPMDYDVDRVCLDKARAEMALANILDDQIKDGATGVVGRIKDGSYRFVDGQGSDKRLSISEPCTDLDCLYGMARKEGCIDWPDYYNRVLVGLRPGDYVVLVTRPGKDREAIWLITGDLTRALDMARTYAANPEVGTCAVEWVDPITKKLMRWRVGDAASTEGSWAKTING